MNSLFVNHLLCPFRENSFVASRGGEDGSLSTIEILPIPVIIQASDFTYCLDLPMISPTTCTEITPDDGRCPVWV